MRIDPIASKAILGIFTRYFIIVIDTCNSRSIAKSSQTAPNLKYNNLAQCANYRSGKAVALLTTIGIDEQLTQIMLS